MLRIQFPDKTSGKVDKRMCVLFKRLAHRIGEIGYQGEVQVGIAVSKISDFEVPDQLMHLLFAEEQRWNCDDGCAGGRNALAEVEFVQGFGVEEGGDSVVDQLDCNLHGRKQQNDDGKCERDRKSTRLNSSHLGISYAVFCLKKKN